MQLLEEPTLEFDLSSASIEDIDAEIDRLELERKRLKNMEQAIKVAINSVYGCLGTPYFIGYNKDVAAAITLQGQHLIQFMETRINTYFMKHWTTDTKTHASLGVKVKSEPIDSPVVIYIDTDSVFINFHAVMETTDWSGDAVDFILKLYEVRLSEYINVCLEMYARKWGDSVINVQNFELENISSRGLFVSGKNYVLEIVWEDPGIRHDKGVVISKGIEMAKASSPRFTRARLGTIIDYIFDRAEKVDVKELISMLKKLKQEFRLANVEEICPSMNMGGYEKGVLEDKMRLAFNSGCPGHVKACAWYNHLLNKDEKLKKKYRAIKSGDKIHVFKAKSQNAALQSFAFHPGEFPMEFAPEVDYDMMFMDNFIGPVNRLIEAMGFPPIPETLVVSRALF